MAKKNDEVLDKKVRARLREDILNEINSTVKDDLVTTVVNDVKDTFDREYKNEIKEEIKTDISGSIKETFQKEQKKLSRRKTFKIIRLNIYIILLIACSLFLVYRLYETGNIDLGVCKTTDNTSSTTTKTTAVIHDFSWLKNKYASLLDNVRITNYELLKGSYETKNIDINDKLAMVYELLDSKDINREGIITTISSDALESKYNDIFNDNLYHASNFSVSGLDFAYSDSAKSYIAVGETSNSKDKLIYNIYDIKENKNIVTISCYVALVRDSQIYNINNLEEIVKANTNNDISDVLDKLSKVDYTFEYTNGSFHLIKIENK